MFKHVCQHCGKHFESKERKQYYCSQACFKIGGRLAPPKLFDRVCVFCGSAFKTKNSYAKCCSARCRSRRLSGYETLEQFNQAQALRRAEHNRQHERNRYGLTLAEVQAVIDAQDGDPALLYERSQSWSRKQRKYARDRYQQLHGLFRVYNE